MLSVRCKTCNRELTSSNKTQCCGCPNMMTVSDDQVSANDLSKVVWLNSINNLKNNNISPISYCLNDLLSHDFDQIIIGINSRDNLNEILNFKLIQNKDNINDFIINDLKLIDPRNWK